MESLAPTVVAAAILMGATTLAARRWGETVGGVLAGLPLTSGPVSVVLAIERGPDFAATAAHGTILGLIAVVAFAVVFFCVSPVAQWWLAASAGVTAFLVVAYLLSLFSISLVAAIVSVVLALITAVALTAGGGALPPRVAAPAWDLPGRMATASAMVLLIAGSAAWLGPIWTGLLSPFPVFACVMAVFSHVSGGPGAARRLLRGVLFGTFGFVAFFSVVALYPPRSDVWATYLTAGVSAIGLNTALMLISAKRR